MMGDCSCNYDPVENMQVRDVKRARKARRCDECRGPIEIGDSYRYTTFVFEGAFCTHAQCAGCNELRSYVVAHIPCFCQAFGELLTNAIDAASEFAIEDGGEELFAEVKAKVNVLRHRAKALRSEAAP